ncbi:double zinc ribbon domain-containing protein [Sphingomonas sp. ac-8]|uniref:ComF family protein n=1 Tax=Sphingomonas sp. ac-8 TaxID=3242977 RepID=UPI003A80C6DB
MNAVAALVRRSIALALPPRCPACGQVTEADHRFCPSCWAGLRFLGPPWCARCALPFDHDRGEDACCAACLEAPPRHAGARAAVAYGAVARDVALKLKYGGRLAAAETMARLMLRQLPPDADLLVPVPLHRRRLWTRGYNQAVLIARALSAVSGVRADAHVLVRTRATPPLRGLGRRARAKALAGAFAVPPTMRPRLNGRKVVLVDDVYTSGATADGCARRLIAAGAAAVTVLCWARVLSEADD